MGGGASAATKPSAGQGFMEDSTTASPGEAQLPLPSALLEHSRNQVWQSTLSSSPPRSPAKDTSRESRGALLVSHGSQTAEKRCTQETKDLLRRDLASKRSTRAAQTVDIWGLPLPPTAEYRDYEVHFRDKFIMNALMESSELRSANGPDAGGNSMASTLHLEMPQQQNSGSFGDQLMTARFGQDHHQQEDGADGSTARIWSQLACQQDMHDEEALNEPGFSVDALEAASHGYNTQRRYDEAFAFTSHTLTDSTSSDSATVLLDSIWEESPVGSPVAGDADPAGRLMEGADSPSSKSPEQSLLQSYMEPWQSAYQSLMEPMKSGNQSMMSMETNDEGGVENGDVQGDRLRLPLQGLVLSGSLGLSSEYRKQRRRSQEAAGSTECSSPQSSQHLASSPYVSEATSIVSWTLAPPVSPVAGQTTATSAAVLASEAWEEFAAGGVALLPEELSETSEASTSTMSWAPPATPPSSPLKGVPSRACIAVQASRAWEEFMGGIAPRQGVDAVQLRGGQVLDALGEEWDMERAESVIASPAMGDYMVDLFQRSTARALTQYQGASQVPTQKQTDVPTQDLVETVEALIHPQELNSPPDPPGAPPLLQDVTDLPQDAVAPGSMMQACVPGGPSPPPEEPPRMPPLAELAAHSHLDPAANSYQAKMHLPIRKPSGRPAPPALPSLAELAAHEEEEVVGGVAEQGLATEQEASALDDDLRALVAAYVTRRLSQSMPRTQPAGHFLDKVRQQLARALSSRKVTDLKGALDRARAAGLSAWELRKAETMLCTSQLQMTTAAVASSDTAGNRLLAGARCVFSDLSMQAPAVASTCNAALVAVEHRQALIAAMDTALSVEGTPLENLATALHTPLSCTVNECLAVLHEVSRLAAEMETDKPGCSATLRLVRELCALRGSDVDRLFGFAGEQDMDAKNLAPQAAIETSFASLMSGSCSKAQRHQRSCQDQEAWAKIGVALSAGMLELTSDSVAGSLLKARVPHNFGQEPKATDALIESTDHAECLLSLRNGLSAWPEFLTMFHGDEDRSPLEADGTPCLFWAVVSEEMVSICQAWQDGQEVLFSRPCALCLRPFPALSTGLDQGDLEGRRNFVCVVEGVRYGVPLWSHLAAERGEAQVLLPALTLCRVIGTPVHGASFPGGPGFTLLRLRCRSDKNQAPRPSRLLSEIAQDDAWLAWRTLQCEGDQAMRTQDVGTFVDALAKVSNQVKLPLSDQLSCGLSNLCSRVVGAAETLDLSWKRLGKLGVEAVASMLESTRCLKHLLLSGNSIGDAGADRLAKAIRRNCTLQTLSLGENGLTNAGIKPLADALAATGAPVQDLWLQRNSIGDQGAHFLATALQSNTKLRQLYLVCTGIGDSGASRLAKALQVNESLRDLFLHENRIGNYGSEHLASALRSNGALRRLDLHGNPIGEVGAKQLLQAWTHNQALEELHLPSGLLSRTPPEPLPTPTVH